MYLPSVLVSGGDLPVLTRFKCIYFQDWLVVEVHLNLVKTGKSPVLKVNTFKSG
jgi:hypothetical protein